MSYLPLEELLPKADGSIYKLVRMATNRALELSEGKPRLIENPSSDKITTIALEEIAQGKIVSKTYASKKGEKLN
ncbi:MAG: DNA-directed RNA polymerase subunit omega [Omnitrophica WOR_2 bacterium GWC2_45_7]|nr:MAG: DNA-directed RNA polymerase subunit omega [Omnitrophica WOR_2 bacterium GWC2_45_7]